MKASKRIISFILSLTILFIMTFGAFSAQGEQKLSKPEGIKISVINENCIKISWKNVKNAKEYQLYRAKGKNGKYSKIATVKKATSYVNSKLKANTVYYYKIKACSGKLVSDFSSPRGAKTKKPSSLHSKLKGTWKSCNSFVDGNHYANFTFDGKNVVKIFGYSEKTGKPYSVKHSYTRNSKGFINFVFNKKLSASVVFYQNSNLIKVVYSNKREDLYIKSSSVSQKSGDFSAMKAQLKNTNWNTPFFKKLGVKNGKLGFCEKENAIRMKAYSHDRQDVDVINKNVYVESVIKVKDKWYCAILEKRSAKTMNAFIFSWNDKSTKITKETWTKA